MTGTYRDTESIIIEIFNHFQPAFDVLQVKAAIDTYAGHWRSKDGENEALISVVDGSLWLDKYSLKGNDLLAILRDDKPEKMALASTGRKHEFRYVPFCYPFKLYKAKNSIVFSFLHRLAKGYRPVTGWHHYGAMSYWVINSPGHCRGAPVDLIYFAADPNGMTLEIPSAGVSLRRP